MDVRSISVFLFCCITGAMIGPTLNQPDDRSIEYTVIRLTQKIAQMEERLRSFEKTEKSNFEERLSVKVEETEKRVSEVEKRFAESITEVSGNLQDAMVRFLNMDTQLLREVQEAQEKSSESLERVRNLEQHVVAALEAKADILQVNMNETRHMLSSFIASRRDIETVIIKNISSCCEKLMYLNDSLPSRFENLATKMRIFDNSLSEIEKNCANVSFVSKLDQSLRHFDKDIKAEIQSLQSELSPRVKHLEERCALREDVAQLNRTLSNHTSQIAVLNTDLLDIQSSCSDPPKIINGYPILSNKRNQDTKNGAVIIYACRGDRTLVGSGGIVCRSGEWTGGLPECMDSCNTEDLKAYDSLDIPMNSIIEHSKSLDISCRPGYVIDSNSETITCYNGTWPISGDPCMKMKESCDDEPPAARNGKTVDFGRKLGSKVRYQCDSSFVMSENSTVHCSQGNWVGQPPVCSFTDDTFYLMTSTRAYLIVCYSVDNYQKIAFSRVFDNGSVADIPSKSRNGQAYLQMRSVRDSVNPENYGFFQCGFSDERGSIYTQVQKQNVDGDLYFLEPSISVSIGDAVELEVKFNMAKEIRWRHNGTELPSWDNKGRVEIPIVQSTDAGIYECYYVGERGITPPSLLRLIVRSKVFAFS